MRIIMPTFEEMKWMPPTISLIEQLAIMGHEVVYVTICPDEYYPHFDQKRVKNVALYSKKISTIDAVPNIRLIKSVAFRIDNILKSVFGRRLDSWLEKNLAKDDLLWIVNEMTTLFGGSSFANKYKDNYIFTIYELHENERRWKHAKVVAQNASVVVVPEYNRAHIQKSYWSLRNVPFVLPNKPLVHPRTKNIPSCEQSAIEKLESLKKEGKKVILYMGGIGLERPLEQLIEAVLMIRDRFEFAILGRQSLYLDYLLQKYPNGFTYLGSATVPDHLTIASYADIGVLIYVPDLHGLNALYCAPNKIFEYTGFGMPVITNDIPGLNYYIDKYHCGVTFDMNSKDNIINAINQCSANYELYSKGAKKLYDDIDISKLISKILLLFKQKSH
ncbi:glycosyltransferase [uncultured Bacteroides sp.]|uniref:glycosyltransferase n=1 Tax=uncultured Bacteroides sp. TaxID=162156 RepID=UPI0008223224|nr:glycosyltransferase [uncultured Bacteroides sp.]SCH97422.1 Glycosyl transferases group 1 [uncultured Bacteroides sp.]